MKTRFEAVLPVPPVAAWNSVTVPALMNRWSEATIHWQDGPDDWCPPSLPGNLRTVTVKSFGMRFRMVETIISATPPSEFVYSVVRGGMLQSHRGTMSLQPDGSGQTRLTWSVEYRAKVPGLGYLMEWTIGPAIRRSLRRLVEVLKQAT